MFKSEFVCAWCLTIELDILKSLLATSVIVDDDVFIFVLFFLFCQKKTREKYLMVVVLFTRQSKENESA